MIELSDDLSTVYTGKQAAVQKISTRLKHTTKDIPYYSRGVDIAEFTYGSQLASIKLAFKDLGANVTYDESNSRIQYYDISMNVNL